MSNRTLQFRLEAAKPGRAVDARDFRDLVSAALECLTRLEKELGSAVSVAYPLVGLEFGSASLTIQPESKGDQNSTAGTISAQFQRGFAALTKNQLSATAFTKQTQESFRRLQKPLKKKWGVVVFTGTNTYRMDSALVVRTQRTKEKVGKATNSVSGRIEALNIHNQRTFFVYPVIGPRVKCEFPKPLLDNVRDAIGRHVTVHGTSDADTFALFPKKIAVSKIDVHPKSDQTKLGDFLGSIPDLTGGEDSVALVRALRDAD